MNLSEQGNVFGLFCRKTGNVFGGICRERQNVCAEGGAFSCDFRLERHSVKFAVNGFPPMTVVEKSLQFCWLFGWKIVILQADYYLQGNKSLEICVLIVPPLA